MSDRAVGESRHNAPEISIVIAVYNEEENIRIVTDNTVDTLESAGIKDYEIVIVNDGSDDNTGRIVNEVAGANGKIRALHHDKNQGFGAALRSGYKITTGKFVTLLPGDGQVGPGQVIKLYRAMDGADIIAAHKTAVGKVHDAPLFRDFLSTSWALTLRVVHGYDYSSLNGVYVIKGDLLRSFKLVSTTGLLNLEVIMNCMKKQCKMNTGDVEITPRLSGTSKVANITTIIKTFWEVFTLKIYGFK